MLVLVLEYPMQRRHVIHTARNYEDNLCSTTLQCGGQYVSAYGVLQVSYGNNLRQVNTVAGYSHSVRTQTVVIARLT